MAKKKKMTVRSRSSKTERFRLWLKGVVVAWLKIISPSRYGNGDGFPTIVPAWVLAALREASLHDPTLSPHQLVPYMRRIRGPGNASSIGTVYASLWRNLNHGANRVFVLGDSDEMPSVPLLQAVRSLALNDRSRVVVIWTGSMSPGSHGGMVGVDFQNLGEICGTRNRVYQTIALGRALLEIQPATIFVASSDVGWAVLRTQAAALSEYSTLFAELPSVERGQEGNHGRTAGMNVATGLSASVRLTVESGKSKKDWVKNFGIDPETIHLVQSLPPENSEMSSMKQPRGLLAMLTDI